MPNVFSMGNNSTRVIVVEDNSDLLEDLVYQLNHAGFAVRGAGDGRQLDVLLHEEDCDILVLDVNLPFESGFQIARRMRDSGNRGVIMLTARDGIDDKLQGLHEGADLYLFKPIDRRELIACIHSLYRRLAPQSINAKTYEGWQLDPALRVLIAPDRRRLELTPQDVQTLSLLLSRPGQVCDRSEVVACLGMDFLNTPNSRVNMVMSRLRQKLLSFDPSLRIQTWRNEGYSFVGPGFK
jgi:DNA-binding response OmpR family regulator